MSTFDVSLVADRLSRDRLRSYLAAETGFPTGSSTRSRALRLDLLAAATTRIHPYFCP